MTRQKIRGVVLGAVCALLVGPTLVGATAAAAARVQHARSHHHPRTHQVQHHRAGIPQHNGGDRDTDNNGAPSDGDGNQ